MAELVDDATRPGRDGRHRRAATWRAAGYFYAPTVLTDVPADARLLREEIFGPVAPISTFGTDDGGDRAWPTTPSTAWSPTSSPGTCRRMLRVGEALEFGMVGINQGIVSNPAAPFGGVKQSGFGREGGFEGIEEYLETKYVGIAP